ncbi:sugar phosphate isomerase/epimerase [Candidatus Poribacteria bacterium]|nr:sugar phosphate isomerase/epimerase [Candidatus Poribacteria bacterium]
MTRTNATRTNDGPRLSVSTWSLHRQLGRPDFYGPEDEKQIPVATHGNGELSLLEVPDRVAKFGINTLELCHFHIPSLDKGYLDELRGALKAANVELFSLLIDHGDITHPKCADQDLVWIGEWIDTAGMLGAACARAIAGKAAPSADTLEMSRTGLEKLAERADVNGVRLMTENWFSILSTPENVLTLLDGLEGKVGLCLDFGNWQGETKYADLKAIAPRAESCHTKAHFLSPGEMDRDDYVRCLDLTQDVSFSGPHTLIYDGPGDDEWEGLSIERKVVQSYL